MTAARLQIVVAGAGPVGLLTAALLADDERNGDVAIRVIDAAPPRPWSADRLDIRVYALSRASQRFFDRLGLWEEVLRRRASPYRTMRVWQGDDPDGIGSVCFEAAAVGEPDLGHIVEDSALREVLLGYLSGAGRVDVEFGTSLAAVEPGSRRVKLATAGGETIRADLLIGADGAGSAVRTFAGIESFRRPYGQRALVAHFRSEKPHRETAWQRFGELGPLALLPLANGLSSMVWSVPDEHAARLDALDDSQFEAEVEAASGSVLGRLGLASAKAGFPLALAHAGRYTSRSVALVGDAAHVVHPLAGQGMNLGFRDAASLAAVVGAAVEAGEYIGDAYVLERYGRRRRAGNFGMQLAFDGIDRLFRAGGPLAALRAGGMLAVDSAPPLKRFLIGRALGTGLRPPAD